MPLLDWPEVMAIFISMLMGVGGYFLGKLAQRSEVISELKVLRKDRDMLNWLDSQGIEESTGGRSPSKRVGWSVEGHCSRIRMTLEGLMRVDWDYMDKHNRNPFYDGPLREIKDVDRKKVE